MIERHSLSAFPLFKIAAALCLVAALVAPLWLPLESCVDETDRTESIDRAAGLE